MSDLWQPLVSDAIGLALVIMLGRFMLFFLRQMRQEEAAWRARRVRPSVAVSTVGQLDRLGPLVIIPEGGPLVVQVDEARQKARARWWRCRWCGRGEILFGVSVHVEAAHCRAHEAGCSLCVELAA